MENQNDIYELFELAGCSDDYNITLFNMLYEDDNQKHIQNDSKLETDNNIWNQLTPLEKLQYLKYNKDSSRLFQLSSEDFLKLSSWGKNAYLELIKGSNKEQELISIQLKNLIYIANNTSKTNTPLNFEFADVSERLLKDAENIGIDISNYKHCINLYSIKHIFNHHSKISEISRNQIPITNNDILLIPDIIENYDYVKYSGKTKSNNLDAIIYQKRYSDGTIYYLEEIRTKKNVLNTLTMYKKKS